MIFAWKSVVSYELVLIGSLLLCCLLCAYCYVFAISIVLLYLSNQQF